MISHASLSFTLCNKQTKKSTVCILLLILFSFSNPRTDDLKTGTLIGEDEFGNKYFQNKKYFFGRSRWVIYNKKFNVDYDGSMIPAAWHRWLHYIGDEPPTVSPPVSKPWMSPHLENPSGTCKEYVPYSTTRPKIESWQPPK
ncbi:NADH dehydrogenase [ubiquinone] 1 alpha subcomplex subunit 12 isoform X1 [Octopus sinensis]|uniref:NADH dehydrogenase [ubiquinone] 1 alpha subcomplex subunit 12 n=1 Tax=Octopus sinensis TaxID=2607531 RepID=A0A7E6FDJ7_9MOLL|nr:NADH dehydrogenase [ubiquinone] 1 alpha subcomplex subunit 12 isoform X1 [Octopus sinensis]